MAKQGGSGNPIYCAILIVTYNGGLVAINEVSNVSNSIDQCTIPE